MTMNWFQGCKANETNNNMEGGKMTVDELRELKIGIDVDNGIGSMGHEGFVAGWDDNGVFVTPEQDTENHMTGECIPGMGYCVSRQWTAGTTAAIDDERDESLRNLTLTDAVALANRMAEERRVEVLAEMERGEK